MTFVICLAQRQLSTTSSLAFTTTGFRCIGSPGARSKNSSMPFECLFLLSQSGSLYTTANFLALSSSEAKVEVTFHDDVLHVEYSRCARKGNGVILSYGQTHTQTDTVHVNVLMMGSLILGVNTLCMLFSFFNLSICVDIRASIAYSDQFPQTWSLGTMHVARQWLAHKWLPCYVVSNTATTIPRTGLMHRRIFQTFKNGSSTTAKTDYSRMAVPIVSGRFRKF